MLLDNEVLLKSNIIDLENDMNVIETRITTNESNIASLSSFRTTQQSFNNSKDTQISTINVNTQSFNNEIGVLDDRIISNENELVEHATKLLDIDTIHTNYRNTKFEYYTII